MRLGAKKWAILGILPAAFILTFEGHCRAPAADCGDDCSLRSKGYEWALENNITDKGMCPDDDSTEFYEGCAAYAKEANAVAKPDAAPADTKGQEAQLAARQKPERK